MEDLDPKLLARFRADEVLHDFSQSEIEFTDNVRIEVMRLIEQRRTWASLKTATMLAFVMAVLAATLVQLSTVSVIGEQANFVDNLTTPLGILVAFGWLFFRKFVQRG